MWVNTVCHRGFLTISADEKSRRLLLRLAHKGLKCFGRFKDGTQLPGEITNTLSLNSLTSSDEGRYKCLATTSDTLPAAVSAEAQVQFIGV